MKFVISLLFLIATSVQAQVYRGSYALFDYDSSTYVIGHNPREVRSIASITKMFTAITILKSGVDLDEKVKVNGRSKGHVPNGIYLSRYDLMRLMIISSDNRAAESLANSHPGGFKKFIFDVNLYAETNALLDTKIVDSTGLLAENTSTARDLVQFLYLIRNEPAILKIAHERNAVLAVPKGKKSITIQFHNTNPDIFRYDNILISKTGFTSKAGRCLLMLVEKDKLQYAVVILGQPTPKMRSQVVSVLMNVETGPDPEVNVKSNVEFSFPVQPY
jgi:D-alanyl-D-alanine carboxypeptidase